MILDFSRREPWESQIFFNIFSEFRNDVSAWGSIGGRGISFSEHSDINYSVFNKETAKTIKTEWIGVTLREKVWQWCKVYHDQYIPDSESFGGTNCPATNSNRCSNSPTGYGHSKSEEQSGSDKLDMLSTSSTNGSTDRWRSWKAGGLETSSSQQSLLGLTIEHQQFWLVETSSSSDSDIVSEKFPISFDPKSHISFCCIGISKEASLLSVYLVEWFECIWKHKQKQQVWLLEIYPTEDYLKFERVSFLSKRTKEGVLSEEWTKKVQMKKKIVTILAPSFNSECGLPKILSCMSFKITLDLQYDDSNQKMVS